MNRTQDRLTKAGRSTMWMAPWRAYFVPLWSFQSCSKVVKPRRKPSDEFARMVAVEPSAGMESEYDSRSVLNGWFVSSTIEGITVLSVEGRRRLREDRTRAERTAEESAALRPTTSLWNRSEVNLDRVRKTAWRRSDGGLGTRRCIVKLEESLTEDPLEEIVVGIGHRATTRAGSARNKTKRGGRGSIWGGWRGDHDQVGQGVHMYHMGVLY